MTNEERQQAIEWLKRRPVTMPGAKRTYNLAVEALEAYVPDMNVRDMISRQQAIDALHMHLMYRMGTDSNKKRLDEWINNLPSIQPKCGKWYIENNGCIVLDVCDQCMRSVRHVAPFYDFCPHCGANMRGEADGNN